jgi:hypothetical protein
MKELLFELQPNQNKDYPEAMLPNRTSATGRQETSLVHFGHNDPHSGSPFRWRTDLPAL